MLGWAGGVRQGWQAVVLMTTVVGAAAALLSSSPGWEMPWAWGWVALGLLGSALTVVWWRQDRLDLRTVLLGALLLRLLMLPFPPLLSTDPYRYLWDGIVQHHGVNPFRHLPSDPHLAGLHDSVEFRRMNSPDFFSVYPPLSQGVFFLAATVRGWGFQASFVLLKLLFMLMETAGLLALGRMVRPRDLMLYAWNPVVVIAVVGQGHTETGMVGMLLLALLAARRGRAGAASLAMAAAGLIKIYPFLLFPLLASRFGWRRMWPGLAAAAVAGAAYFDAESLRHLGTSLRLYLSYFEFNAGPYFLLRYLGWEFGGGADPRPWISGALALVFAAAGLAVWWWHRRGRIPLEIACFLILAAYIVCSRTVHTWYLAGVLCLTPFVPPAWRWPWYWLAGGAWGCYLFYVDRTYWPFVLAGWIGWAAGLAVATIFRRARSKGCHGRGTC